MSRLNTSAPETAAGPWVESWLGLPRFRVYLRAAKDDRSRALALYVWNAHLSAAVFRDIGCLEVALRNAYDAAIDSRWQGTQHWLFDPASPVRRPEIRNLRIDGDFKRKDINDRFRQQIEKAQRGLWREFGDTPPAGKLIAELNFGFWRYMTSSNHRELLWVPYLHHAFPPRTNIRHVDQRVGRVYKLRNRAAHHEPLISEPVEAVMGDLLSVAGMLQPELCELIRAFSDVDRILKARP